MIARAGEDGPRAAAMIDTGPEAPPMSAILGGQRAPESELLTTYINLNKNLCGLILFEGKGNQLQDEVCLQDLDDKSYHII